MTLSDVWPAAALALCAASAQAGPPWSVESPNRELAFVLTLDPAAGRLAYAIERGSAGSRSAVLQPSPLGLRRQDQSFDGGLRFVSAGAPAAIDETYTAAHGKRRTVRHQARQQSFTFENGAHGRLELIVRVADDGVAFRHRFPE